MSEVKASIRDSNPDVVFTEISSYVDGELVCQRVLGLKQLIEEKDLVRFCIRGAVLAAAGTYRRANILAIGGYREQLWQAEDFDFHIRLAATGLRYCVIDDPLVDIRVRRASRSQNQVEVWTSAAESIRMLARELGREYWPDLAEGPRV